MKWRCSLSVRVTAVYADIFDFALSDEELVRWLLVPTGKQSYSAKEILSEARRVLTRTHSLWTVPGRERLAAVRKARAESSRVKSEQARRIAKWLACIPSVLLIGITGGLTMDNAKQEDDVDLFFVVSDGTIWISRFLAVAIVELIARRRRPGDTEVADTICLNMFVTERALGVPFSERDVYAAHEVLQMRPLFDRNRVYIRFLIENVWVKELLPNAWKKQFQTSDFKYQKAHTYKVFRKGVFFFLRVLEIPARFIQMKYMERKRTTEVITDDILRFHPKDARPWVYRAFIKRCRQYKITLDNTFWRV